MKNNFPIKRKIMIFLILIAIVLLAISNTPDTINASSNKVKNISAETNKVQHKLTKAEEAKNLLIDGNERFIAGTPSKKDISEEKRKDLAINGQKPFAVILSCSDSRVPPEIVFDQALGDLFVVRNAGNVVDPVVLGSIEYAVDHLNVPLIVVMGHENCGAVKAAVNDGKITGNLDAIINKIKPLCDKLNITGSCKSDLYEKCTDENIKNSAAEISKSPVIKRLVAEKKVSIITAKYHIETGKVIFQ